MSKWEYSPKRDIRKAIKDLKSTSPIEISKYLSNKYNQDISADSISKWLARNPHKKEKLEREISKKSDEIRKRIWECIERGESKEEIMQKTQCSKTHYHRTLKDYENHIKRSKDDESKDSPTIEPTKKPKKNMHIKKPLFVSVQKTRVQARNRVYPQKETLKPLQIKLNLKEHYQTAIRHALDNSYRWTRYNIQEIRDYLKDTEIKLNPCTLEFITAHPHYVRPYILHRHFCFPDREYSMNLRIHNTKELYKELGIEWKQPKASIWIKLLLHLWETSRATRGLTKEYLTIKEWYEKMELEFPKVLELEADMVITNRKDLERTGIFEDIEYNIKRELGIDDELENYYHTTEKLTTTDIWHINNLLRENPNHQYSVLLKEKLQDNENIK